MGFCEWKIESLDVCVMNDIVFGLSGKAYADYFAKIEGYVRLYVKPRPWWMPEWAYRALMSRVVLYEELPKGTLE